MPNPKQKNQRKRQQRALQKRSQRSVKIVRRYLHDKATKSPTGVLRHANQFPITGCWIQPGWQRYGTAALLIARTQPTDEIVFARFLVDTFCLGVKHTFYGTNIDPTRFSNEILPRLFQGEPPISLNADVAHEIVYGAIDYADTIGFRPHRNFRRTRQLLDPEGAYPPSGAIEFGYQGRPAYFPNNNDNQVAILNRLLQTVGRGNFAYIPVGEPAEGFEDLVDQTDQDEQGQSLIWTPQQDPNSGRLDEASGLWSPNQPDETPSDEGTPPRSSLWVPGT